MPDDSLKKLNPLDILVPGAAPVSPSLLPLDGSQSIRLVATTTRLPVLDLAVNERTLVFTLHADSGPVSITMPWVTPLEVALAVKWKASNDSNGYVLEVPPVLASDLSEWVVAGNKYSAPIQQNGLAVVFRPKHEPPK